MGCFEEGERIETSRINIERSWELGATGVLIFHDGAFYEGYFREDKMSGRGTLYYNIGKPAYDGFWSNNSFHGKGKLYS